MYGFQQLKVSKNSDLIPILTFLCEQSHKLTNMGIYYARQLYFKSRKGIGKYDAGIGLQTQLSLQSSTFALQHNKY